MQGDGGVRQGAVGLGRRAARGLRLLSRAHLPAGKLPPKLLAELLDDAPPLPDEVKLGPGIGEDACAIEVAAGTLVAATDPITLTGDDVGAHAVAINANDVAVMGVRPRWFLAVLMLPLGTSADDVRALFARMRESLEASDIALVGGHSEITGAVRQPVVVGQMLGLAESGRFVRTGGLVPGDVVLQVGSAPIEGAAVLAAEGAEALASVPAELRSAALRASADPGISVVAPALLAAERGARALHDPTEGGLSAGLHELALASQVALEIDDDAILWFEPGRAVCRALELDPWGTLASGALLAGFPESAVEDAQRALAEAGMPVARIGRAREGSGVTLRGGAPLREFERDEVARALEVPPEA